MTHVICPGCESTVRELDDTPCPNCRRCPLCGRKLKKGEEHCGLHPAADFGRYFSALVIAEKDVPRERRRMEIRKQLELRKVLAITIPVCLMATIILPIIRESLFGERTLANMAGSACSFAIFTTIAIVIVSRVFRRIEIRRLEAEFPSKRLPQIETPNDLEAR